MNNKIPTKLQIQGKPIDGIKNWKITIGKEDKRWALRFGKLKLPSKSIQITAKLIPEDTPTKAKFFQEDGSYFEGEIVFKKIREGQYTITANGPLEYKQLTKKERIKSML